MSLLVNILDTYFMAGLWKGLSPVNTFFRDRYFPTEAGDIFAADKVLTEYQKGDRKMACFVAPRVGDIPVERKGYAIHEYQPAYIAPSRLLTIDDLSKRGFGEAIFPGSTPAERAARLQLRDLTDLDRRIRRLEEWMAVQTMINNGCTMQEYVDANTVGEQNVVLFYDGTSHHTYTVGTKWDANGGDFFGDVRAMCNMLARRGLPAADLVLGTAVADAILELQKVRDLLDKNSGIIIGEVNQNIAYPGVTRMGVLNFGGFRLTLWAVSESYEDNNNTDTPYFPAKSAMVTAPGCGHMMYGQITQINFGSTDFTSVAAARVPKFIVDQDKDVRKLRLGSRPLAAPKNYCPWIYAANAVN